MDFFYTLLNTPIAFALDFLVPFLLVLTILVFVHEWGHFIVARMNGVKVDVFSIGFGREIFGFNDKHGTRWKFSLLPLGGYVKMFGDEDPSSLSVDEDNRKKYSEKEKKVAFYSKTVGQRAAIVFAGPAINFLFAIVLLAGLYAMVGKPYTPPIVGGVLEQGPADIAGIKPDDRIVKIEGQTIDSFQDIQQSVLLKLDQPLSIVVERGGQEKEFTIVPEKVIETNNFGFVSSRGRIGITSVSGSEIQEFGFVSSIVEATLETGRITWGTLEALGQMISGTRSTDELGGVIRIGALAGQFAESGLLALVTFTALLSINLGLINLFPIPLLDGGHLVFYGYEAVRGKPMNEKAQEYFFRVGFMFVVGLMLFATWNDLVQLKVVEYFINLVS